MPKVGEFEVPERILVRNPISGREEPAIFYHATRTHVIYIGEMSGIRYRFSVREASLKTPYT